MPRKISKKIQQTIEENFSARTKMSRAYFIERLHINGFEWDRADKYTPRHWYKNRETNIAIGDHLNPYGITIINVEVNASEKFKDYGQAYAFLRNKKLIGCA